MMKVHVKLAGTGKTVEVGENDQCTLSQLRERTVDAFSSQLVGRSFTLSLNKSDALSGEDRTLSELGIVAGDLIFVLCPDQGHACNLSNNASGVSGVVSSASSSSSSCASDGAHAADATQLLSGSDTVACHDMDTDGSEHQILESLSETRTSQSVPANNTVPETTSEGFEAQGHNMELLEDHVQGEYMSAASLEDPEVNRCLQEPLLCRESSSNAVPVLLRDLYQSARCVTMADALWVVVHTLMMEVGFRPLQDADLALEEDWNQRGFYKQEYRHLCVSVQHSCSVVGVPMGPSFVLHGVCGGDPPMKTDSHQLKVADYVREQNIRGDVCGVFRNLERLSRTVKDLVCQPMLTQLSEVCGFPVSLGLLSLSYELKLKVLSYLPASSLVKMGQVCREYNITYRDPCLWRRLHLREFGRNGDNSLNKDWYRLYKEEYQLRKERRKSLRHRHQMLTGIPPWLNPPLGHFPALGPAPYTSPIIGGDYDLNPEFASGIPHPLLGRPTGPNPFLPQGPGAPGGPLLPRPRFSDPFGPGAGPGGPFGPGAGPGGPFMALGGGASCNSQASAFSSFRGHRFL